METKGCKAPASSKPLAGRVYYLDVKPSKKREQLKTYLLRLGAHLEDFLSKDVNYLVTDRQDGVQLSGTNDLTPRTNGDPWLPDTPASGLPSPTFTRAIAGDLDVHFPDSPLTDSFRTPSLQPPVQSRGQALLERAVKHKVQKRGSADVLEVSRQWGIKILPVRTLLLSLEQLLKSSTNKADLEKGSPGKKKVGERLFRLVQLHAPFVKVEDIKREYRPFYRDLPEVPDPWRNEPKNIPAPQSEDENEELRTPKSKIRKRSVHSPKEMTVGLAAKANELYKNKKKQKLQKVTQPRTKVGYCEICSTSYANLAKHMLSETHSAFMSDENNFSQLKELVLQLPTVKSLKQRKKLLSEVSNELMKDPSDQSNTQLSGCNTPRMSTAKCKKVEKSLSSSPPVVMRTRLRDQAIDEPLFSDSEDNYVEPSCSSGSCTVLGCPGGIFCFSGPLYQDCPSPAVSLLGSNAHCNISSCIPDSSPEDIQRQPPEAHLCSSSSSVTIPFITLDMQPLNLSYKPKLKCSGENPCELNVCNRQSDHVFFSENACVSTLSLKENCKNTSSVVPPAGITGDKKESISFSNCKFPDSKSKDPKMCISNKSAKVKGLLPKANGDIDNDTSDLLSVRKALFMSDVSSPHKPAKKREKPMNSTEPLFDSDKSFSSCSYSEQMVDAMSSSAEEECSSLIKCN